jgi:hypothetical protein
MARITAWVWVIPVFFSISASWPCVIEGMRTLSCFVLGDICDGLTFAPYAAVEVDDVTTEQRLVFGSFDNGRVARNNPAAHVARNFQRSLCKCDFHFLYPPRLGVPYLLSDYSIALCYTFVKGYFNYFLRTEKAGFWA